MQSEIPPIPFDNRYARLPGAFYARIAPTPVKAPAMIRFNHELAQALGLDTVALDGPAGALIFGGNQVPERAEPLAMAYAGHQFGHFNPQLGDGRAILLGELTDRNGQRFAIQLKGSGRTPFSRGGDGRAQLGPVLREYVLCEFMHAMGIPTTRALAAVSTGESVARDRLYPGGIITRVSASFVRVGTFQFFAARGNREALQQLLDYVIAGHYPELQQQARPWLGLLEAVIRRQAGLIAHWMQIGFIHGVMNTDNMSIVGESIDYGPCAFMDRYQADTVYSSIDREGRYAYRNQPGIAHWNLCRLAETLLPLATDPEAELEDVQALVNAFPVHYEAAWLAGMRAKLGLAGEGEEDRALVEDWLGLLERGRADFTLAFRALSALDGTDTTQDARLHDRFEKADGLAHWLERWRARLARDKYPEVERRARMLAVNPLYIPRNHQLEKAIRAAEDHADFGPFQALVNVLAQPFEERPGASGYERPPEAGEAVLQTFCGT
ncbi:MAG: YdiU family protein [Thiothrix sp.]|nr:YdiU family protein [Thiothrix sp.]HPE62003.1 YdiU family protein [Thiolinea sp.]